MEVQKFWDLLLLCVDVVGASDGVKLLGNQG